MKPVIVTNTRDRYETRDRFVPVTLVKTSVKFYITKEISNFISNTSLRKKKPEGISIKY